MTSRDPAAHLARMAYERNIAEAAQGGSQGGLDAAGPPIWDRTAWETWKAQTGDWPFGLQSDGSMINPPSFENCPDWAYTLMKMRKPPVAVNNSGMGTAPTPADRASVFGMRG